MPPLPLDPGRLLAQAQEAGDGMTWADVLTAATQVAVLLSALAAAYWGLRRWVQRAARDSEAAAYQVRTSNGKTLASYVESTSEDIGELRRLADANRVRIDALDARLDRHIVIGHRD